MVVGALNKKIVRDISTMKAQIASISLIVALGIGTLFGFTSTYYSLEEARTHFYTTHSFANLFLSIKSAPTATLETAKSIEGVLEVESRIVQEALTSIPNYTDPVAVRFISIPDGKQPKLNKIFLKKGRLPKSFENDSVIVSEAFFLAHKFKLGDTFLSTLNGKRKEFKIVGVGITPEYLFAIHGSSPVPDDLHFGIAWINQTALESAYQMNASFNNLIVKTNPNINEKQIMSSMDLLFDKYGSLGTLNRDRQISHNYLSEEIKQLKVQAFSVPLIFLLVAAFILNVVLSRLIATHRSEVASLKALGFYDSEIAGYYYKIASLIVIIGVIAGLGLGLWIGQAMTELYSQFYRFPELRYVFSYFHFLISIIISSVTATLGVSFALKKIFSLAPAEAMRPPTPVSYHDNLIERSSFFQLMDTRIRMALRGLTTTPVRSILSGLGISFAILLLISGLFWNDSMDLLLTAQYRFIQKETGTITLTKPLERKAIFDVLNLKGVLQAEGYRIVPVKIKHKNIETTTTIMALPSSPTLRTLVDENLKEIPISDSGIFISQGLAKKLGVQDGDVIGVEILEGKKPKHNLSITHIIDSFMGDQIITTRKTLSQILHEDDLVNLISFYSNPKYNVYLYTAFKEMPYVIGVSFKTAALETFNETSAKYILVFGFILAFFAGAIGFGIMYNNARITLAERDWEMATLQILGFTTREVFSLIFSEIIILLVLFLPLGAIFGYYYSQYLITKMTPESFQIPFYISPSTFAYAIITLSLSAVISGLLLYMRIRKLDIVATLKSRN